MILVGNSRGGAKDLARHLTKDENDHVEVHQLRGFASDNLHGALNEAYAVSKGTKCRQFLFSLSLNPPSDAQVSTESFESAIDRCEQELGLEGQPRAIVFHEKEGRRHAHAVWSRIDAQTLTARQLSFHKNKLQDVSRELYREHGWRMPEGLADRSKSDPRNFTLNQWQQAKRNERDPRDIKNALSDAWSISDSRGAFEHALKERGYWLARGDRRGFVALDYHGEVYSLPRWAGVKTKAVREKLGDEGELRSVDETKAEMGCDMERMLSRLQDEQYEKAAALKAEHNQRKTELVECQRQEREVQVRHIQERQDREQAERQARFRRGLAGLWDRLRGEHRRLTRQNELEAIASSQRDRAERDATTFRQLEKRRVLSQAYARKRSEIEAQQRALLEDRKRMAEITNARGAFKFARQVHSSQRRLNERPTPRAPPKQAKSGTSGSFDEAAQSSQEKDKRRTEFVRQRTPKGNSDRGRDDNQPDLER